MAFRDSAGAVVDESEVVVLGNREEEYVEAVVWTEQAARSPGAHVFMAVLAAAAQSLAGNKTKAAAWAADVRERGPSIRSADFFRGYPVRAEPMRTRIANALQELGFQAPR